MVWIVLSLVDGKWVRTVFETVLTISFLGPFAGYWVGLGMLMWKADKKEDRGSVGWSHWKLWVTLPILLAYTIFSMVMQIIMVPGIFDWVDNAPINPNKKQGDNGPADNTDSADEGGDATGDGGNGDFLASGLLTF